MKKIFTLLIAVLSTVFFVHAIDNASFNWFLAGGGIKTDSPSNVVTDANGNIFVAASFQTSLTFNKTTTTGADKGSGANPDNNIFISKMSSTKTNLWSIYSNKGAVSPTSIAVSPTGDLYVTGTMRAIVNTASQTDSANIIDAAGTKSTFIGLKSATATAQSFVAKFNSNGILQWVKEINSGKLKDQAVTTTALTTDVTGNVYVAGIFTTGIIIPGSSDSIISRNTTQSSFITKLATSDGNSVWTKTTSGGITSEIFNALSIGEDGYLYAAGIFRNVTIPIEVNIGTTTTPVNFTPSAGYDIILLKLSTDGIVSYVQNRTNTSDTRVKDILIKDNKAYVCGSFRGDAIGGGIKFGTDTLKSTAAYLNGFIAAFNAPDGSDCWRKTVLAPAIAEVMDVAIGGDNNLYALGTHYNALGTAVPAAPVLFGDSYQLVDDTNKMGDMFLAGYNAVTGTTKEVHIVAKGSKSETGVSMCSFENKLYVLGKYSSTELTFENNSTTSTAGTFDFFLANYTLSDPSGLTSSSSKSISVYVDKTNRAILIKNSDKIVAAKLISVTGATIKTLASKGTIESISIQGIASGVYILQLTDKAGKTTAQRLIIQ